MTSAAVVRTESCWSPHFEYTILNSAYLYTNVKKFEHDDFEFLICQKKSKHVCLNNDKGIDSKFSLKVSKLKEFKDQLLESYMSIGKISYGASKNEKPYLKFRRSIYCSSNILKGEKFTKNNVKIIRPSFGIEPKYFEKILGKFSKKDIKFATALKWKYIKN